LESEWVKKEITYALERSTRHQSNIIPIIIKDKEFIHSVTDSMSALKGIQMVDFTKGNLQDELTSLISILKTKEMG